MNEQKNKVYTVPIHREVPNSASFGTSPISTPKLHAVQQWRSEMLQPKQEPICESSGDQPGAQHVCICASMFTSTYDIYICIHYIHT